MEGVTFQCHSCYMALLLLPAPLRCVCMHCACTCVVSSSLSRIISPNRNLVGLNRGALCCDSPFVVVVGVFSWLTVISSGPATLSCMYDRLLLHLAAFDSLTHWCILCIFFLLLPFSRCQCNLYLWAHLQFQVLACCTLGPDRAINFFTSGFKDKCRFELHCYDDKLIIQLCYVWVHPFRLYPDSHGSEISIIPFIHLAACSCGGSFCIALTWQIGCHKLIRIIAFAAKCQDSEFGMVP